MNESHLARGDSPSGREFYVVGKKYREDRLGTGTTPHFSQWIIGIGVPQ